MKDEIDPFEGTRKITSVYYDMKSRTDVYGYVSTTKEADTLAWIGYAFWDYGLEYINDRKTGKAILSNEDIIEINCSGKASTSQSGYWLYYVNIMFPKEKLQLFIDNDIVKIRIPQGENGAIDKELPENYTKLALSESVQKMRGTWVEPVKGKKKKKKKKS